MAEAEGQQEKSIQTKPKKSLGLLLEQNAGYLAIVAGFLLFILTKNAIFGLLVLIGFGYQLFSEVGSEVKEKGWKKELIETVAMIAAIFILWKALGFALGTENPISAIATCSMAPNMMAGDFVLVKKELPNTDYVQMNGHDVEKIKSTISLIDLKSGDETPLNYSIMTECGEGCRCIGCNSLCIKNQSMCTAFMGEPQRFAEKRGELLFTFRKCQYIDLGTGAASRIGICSDKIIHNEQEYGFSHSKGTIAYKAKPSDVFASVPGDIIHRVILGIKTENNTYFITKGDHNDRFDMQMDSMQTGARNSLVSWKDLSGNLLGRIPYLGYLKLFLSLRFEYPTDCDSELRYFPESIEELG